MNDLPKVAKIDDLYQPSRLVPVRAPEQFRVTYTRRGSDVAIGTTPDGLMAQVTQTVHGRGVQRVYRYTVQEITALRESILTVLAAGGFKLKHRAAAVKDLPPETTTASPPAE